MQSFRPRSQATARPFIVKNLGRVLLYLLMIVPAITAAADSLPRPGLYRAPDRAIGINRFITDAGEHVLLFADYQSGIVRRLFPAGESELVIGPAFGIEQPVEMRLRAGVDAGDGGEVLKLQPVDGEITLAQRVPLEEHAVTFTNGDVKLSGTLILPPGQGPHPAIILLHGSGPLTRYSFGPYPNFFASLGLAVLVYDKRGAGDSTGTRLDASTGASAPLPDSYYPDVLTEDALAAFRFLQEQPRIDRRRIGLWGSSEGGMLTTQVAARNQDVAFAINSSGFMGPLWKTLLYQAGAIPKSNGKTEAEAEEARKFGRQWMDVARTGKGFEQFDARRAQLKGSQDWMLSYFSAYYSSAEQMRWDWDHILAFDPLPALSRVRCPVLGMFGGLDPLTEAPVAVRNMRAALARAGNNHFTHRIFPDGSHSLTEMPDRKRMAPGVFDSLRDWLKSVLEPQATQTAP